MMRWNCRKSRYTENVAIDAFIQEVLAVCRSHGFSISHEDSHGAFIIENYTASRDNWLRAAHDDTTRTSDPNPAAQPNSNTKES